MNKSKRLLIVFALFAAPLLRAQSGTADDPGTNLSYSAPDIIPPSPQAFAFTKYGNLPVGLFTGTAQYSVPIYVIKSGSLTHALSLSYSTNGVKVDEMATRTGIGWNLTAGGAITRTVQGLPDEFSSRSFYHGTPPSNSSDWWNYVRQAGYATPPDFQPDEYSFNVDGMSGKFIKREDGSFKVLSANAVIIQQTTSPAGFLLTATNGYKYFFNVIETTKTLSLTEPIAPENQPGYSATSWFLTKILTPTKDSIVFNYTSFGSTLQYENGISQEYSTYIPGDYSYRLLRFNDESNYISEPLGPACMDPECLYLSTNTQITGSNAYYLSSISFKGGSVQLSTSLREDVASERRIDSIHVFRSADNARIKSFALKYVYSFNNATTYSGAVSSSPLRKRLYLTEVHELSTTLGTAVKTRFEYDDMNGLPPRLSFSQDKSGYFNGKVNPYFFPNDTWVDKFFGGAGFGGDRNFDFTYAKKGVLKKVIYPTGGSTTIEYEPHRVKNWVVWRPVIDSSSTVKIDTSTTINQNLPFYTDTFSLVPGVQLRLRARCDWATTPAPFFPEAYVANISIVDATTNNCVYACSGQIMPGTDWIDYQLKEHLAGLGTLFKVQISAAQARLRIKATVDKITLISDTSASAGIGGIRVKSIVDSAYSSGESGRREFIYGDWENPSNTSGTGLFIDPANNQFVSAVRRFASKIYNSTTPDGSRKFYAGTTIIHSNSVRSIYTTESGTVVYSKVIELQHSSAGTNNGGTEYNFHTVQASNAQALASQPPSYVWSFSPFIADGAPRSNDDFLNGQQKSVLTFSYVTKGGTRNILNEKQNYYSVNYLTPSPDTFYLVRQIRKRNAYSTSWNYFSDYDVNRYLRFYGWVKLDSTVVKQFESGGTISTKTNFTYSQANYQVRQTSSIGSDQLLQKVIRKYPTDILPADPKYPIYSGMVLQNIIDPVVEEAGYKDPSNQLLYTKKTGYANVNLGSYNAYLPDTLKSGLMSFPLEADVRFDLYDDKGNILQITPKSGPVMSIIWGYDKQYPVAKITGRGYNDVVSASSLNMTIVNAPASDNALRTELNKLRALTNCQVTTLTYSPMLGITSESDINNRTTYYEYDEFNRLSLIRDKDSNIVKKICYNYTGQPETCGMNADPSWQNTSTAPRCKTIDGTNTGEQEQEQQDVNPASPGYGTTRWQVVIVNCTVCSRPATWEATGITRCQVDGGGNNTGYREMKYINTESCSPDYQAEMWSVYTYDATVCPVPAVCDSSNCSGNDKKCVNGVCETGVWTCTGSTRLNSTVWRATYRYKFSDNTYSSYYQEIEQNSPCIGGPLEF